MAHEIDLSNGRANIAYVGQKPWHGLGFQISPDASVEEWRKAAGLDFSIETGQLVLRRTDGALQDVPELNRSILYRSDTHAPLSVMSTDKFHVVQPSEILQFIGDSVKAMGWKIETAGSIRGGRKIWALANIGEEAEVGKGDKVKGYLLAATACDGTLASEFLFTTVRVVCNNTLHTATRDSSNTQPKVKVYHFNKLDVGSVKSQLGIAESVWGNFIERAKTLASIKLDDKQAVKVLRSVYEKPKADAPAIDDAQFLKENTTARRVLELYQGGGIGSDLLSARNTGWGLVNAATEFYDHASKTWSTDNRLNSAWFGTGAKVKQDVVDAVFEIVG